MEIIIMNKINKKIAEWLKTKGVVIIKENKFVVDKALNYIEVMRFLNSIELTTSWNINYELNKTLIEIKQ